MLLINTANVSWLDIRNIQCGSIDSTNKPKAELKVKEREFQWISKHFPFSFSECNQLLDSCMHLRDHTIGIWSAILLE